MLCVSGAIAQTVLTGTVTSKADGAPVPGATVIPNNDSGKGTSTDFDGQFTVEVSQRSGVITITSIGFKTVELSYDGSANLTIELEEELNSLDEIVLIGYGSSKKGDITSAIATVENVETISSRPVANVSDFLQGNLPGVTISQNGGDPSSDASIVIRGLGTLSGQSPLYVVDGMPYYGPAINPNDIASISVLKDAASASIYGAQAASGVVVIETKKGKLGSMTINLDSYAGFQSATNLPTPLNAEQNNYVYNTAADNAGSPRLSAHDASVNPWGAVTRTNWMDEIFRDAAIYNVNATVSGATEKANYMTSFGYNKVDGVLIGTGKDRYSFRVKSEYKLNDKIKVGENVYFSRTEAVGTDTSSGYSGAIINAIYMPSAATVYNTDGTYQGVTPLDLADFAGAYGDVYNPVALLLRPTTSSPVNYINADAFFNYEIVEGLTFRSSFNYAITDTKYKRFVPQIKELGRANSENYLYQSYSNTNRWIWDNQVNFKRSFGNHNLDLTAVYSSQHTDYEYFYQQGRGFSVEDAYNQYMSNASDVEIPVTDVYEDALTSAIARAMYNFKDTYFVSGSIRRDETSRLAKNNRSDYFPSVTAGWRISNESFFSNLKTINDLKLRASWGEIGNIQSVGYYSFDVPLNTTTVVMGQDGVLGDKATYVGRQSNPNLKWETSESFDVGLDAVLLDNHLSITADYFNKKTKGMILPGLEDAHQGTSAADVNGGDVKNTGWEFAASYSGGNKDFGYTVRGNMSMIDNELVSLQGYNAANIDYLPHGDNVRGVLSPFRSKIGEELYSYYLVPFEGIFQSQAEIDAYTHNGSLIQPNAKPGDLKFRDSNNDGKIDSNDKVFMGSYQPDVTYSFGVTLNYKGFDLNAIFQGVAGVKVFNAYKYTTYNASLQGYNLDNRVLGAWTTENTNTNIPRLSTGDSNGNFGTTSSWYLEDASYVRLKNLTVGYTIPQTIMNRLLEGSNLRFYISADNLFTITDYSGMDPEVGSRGLDVGRYPLSGKYVAGLSLSF